MMFETLETRSLFSVVPFDGGTLDAIHGGTFTAVPGGGGGGIDPGGPGIELPDDAAINTRGATFIDGGTLYVTGTSGNDRLRVSWTPYGEVIVTRNGADYTTLQAASIQRITVVGHEGNDELLVVEGLQRPSRLLGGAGNDRLFGGSDADYLEGSDGNDWIVGGRGNDTLTGGAGNDQVFGELGDDTLYGGDGNDTLVSVFGGSDAVHGDGGWDIFVVDKDPVVDRVTDADTLAIVRKSVYRIDHFANPVRAGTNPKFDTTLGTMTPIGTSGRGDIADPALTSTATAYVRFDNTPLFTAGGPRMSDVRQQGLGDCWLAAVAAGVAGPQPWVIQRTVVPLGDGTYMVALGDKHYRVDTDLPVNKFGGVAYAAVNGPSGASLWFPLIEKGMAYHASWLGGALGGYSYQSIVGDSPSRAYGALRLSNTPWLLSPGGGQSEDQTWALIRNNAGKPMTLATRPSATKLVGNHAYSIVRSFVDPAGKRMITVRNPWGHNGDVPSTDGQVTLSFRDAYRACLNLYIQK